MILQGVSTMSMILTFIKNNSNIIDKNIYSLLIESRESKHIRQLCFQQYKLISCEFYKELLLWAAIDPIHMKVEVDVYTRLMNKKDIKNGTNL
jgi:hypothetical protein